jgi:hypothetical protein
VNVEDVANDKNVRAKDGHAWGKDVQCTKA